MNRAFHKVVAVIAMALCLCINAGAISLQPIVTPSDDTKAEFATILRASGAFNTSVKPHTKIKGNTNFSLEASETVRINVIYSPENASVDFGLVGPDNVFHYISTKNGSINTSFKIPKSGNYRLGIKNTSGQTIRVSGFVKY